MIHTLEYRCWRVDTGPGAQPHYLTQAEAEEAAAAAADDRDPQPVEQQREPCWMGECDRYARPFDDEDERYSPWHTDTTNGLTSLVRSAGWTRVDEQGLWCPDCAAAPPERGRVRVTLAERTGREVSAERTACPQLVLSPRYDRRFGHWLGLELIHRPTGRALPLPERAPVRVLLRVAELLVDWAPTDPAHYAAGYTRPVFAALQRASRERAEETPA